MKKDVARLTVLLPVQGEERLGAARAVLEELSRIFSGGTCFAGEIGSSVVRGWWKPNQESEPGWDKHWRVEIEEDLDDSGNILKDVEALNNAAKIAKVFRKHYTHAVAQTEIYVTSASAVSHKLRGTPTDTAGGDTAVAYFNKITTTITAKMKLSARRGRGTSSPRSSIFCQRSEWSSA